MNPSQLRVLSYNIHKGFAMGNRRFVLTQIRAAMRQLQPDIVFLQEVGDNETHRKLVPDYPLNSQLEYLADEMWPHFAYGKNAIYEGGHHGNAILSRWPIEAWHNLDISTNRFENRGLLHTILKNAEGTSLHALSVHLNLLEKSRRRQLEMVCTYIQEHIPASEKIILAGDFNDWRQNLTDPLMAHLGLREVYQETHGAHARTFPSAFPLLTLDRIYFRNLQALEAWRLRGDDWSKLSDHLALGAVLSW